MTYIPRADFKKAAETGMAPDDALLRKQFIAESIKAVETDQGARSRQFVISTQAVDRDNDTVSPTGWHLDNFRKNPVMLYAHDYTSLPIGKCTEVKVDSGKLVATATFADHPMAETVLRLVDGGFLNATSVGFRPIRYEINEERRGLDFEEQELLEFSIVPVPANPEALIIARAAGHDLDVMRGWAETVLEAFHADKGVWLPAKKADALVKGARKQTALPLDAATLKATVAEAVKEAQAEMKLAGLLRAAKLLGIPCEAAADRDEATLAKRIEAVGKSGCYCCADHGGTCDPAGCSCCSASGQCTCSCCQSDYASGHNGHHEVDEGPGKGVKAVAKRGRTLSAANEGHILAAKTSLDLVLDSLQRSPSDGEPDDDDETNGAKATDGVIVIVDDEAEDTFLLGEEAAPTPDEVRDAVVTEVKSAVAEAIAGIGEVIKRETESAVSKARGRID